MNNNNNQKTCIILLWLTPDDFTRQGESSRLERVKITKFSNSNFTSTTTKELHQHILNKFDLRTDFFLFEC